MKIDTETERTIFSILLITTNKTNGNLTTDQTKIDLVPCPAAYLTSWLSPLAIPPTDNF